MSEQNLYNLSNKIRTLLLTKIDKEVQVSSKKNHLLINSQNQKQLMKKFVNYRDFTIKTEELFEGVKINGSSKIFYDIRYNYSAKKLNCPCRSTKTSNKCLCQKNLNPKSLSPKKKRQNSCLKKTKKPGISLNNLHQMKIDSGKKLSTEMKSSSSCNEVLNLKNSLPLKNNNRNNRNKKNVRKLSADLYIYSVDNKNDDSLKLINYCYKLKKPNDEIINEISDDDTITNKKNNKILLFPHLIKNDHKNIPKKKLKKTINKKKIPNKNSNNCIQPLLSPNKKSITNFTNEMKLYFDNVEKSQPKEKIKNEYIGKKQQNIEFKNIDTLHWKNISQLHHNNSKSHEKKSKEKKLEQELIHKKPQNLAPYFKTIDNNFMTLKNKEKKEKREKYSVSIGTKIVNAADFFKKRSKSSKLYSKNNDKFEQNGMFCFGKKIFKNSGNKRKESNKNKRKNINIANGNYNKIIHRNDSIENKQNLKIIYLY